jgi:fatty acid desaturase
MFQGPILAAEREPADLYGLRHRIDLETGGGYRAFRRALRPDYRRVKRDLALGYGALALVLAGAAAAAAQGPVMGPLAALLAGVLVGYLVAYLQLFIHEAAHYNLAAERRHNDRLADSLICWQVGTCIAAYRKTHAEHHRSLGRAADTETSYARPLTLGFVAQMVTGIHALRVFLGRSPADPASRAGRPSRLPLLRGAAAHLLILGLLGVAGAWWAALAWLIGMGVFFPLFATLRQLLEHRPDRGLADAAEGDGAGAVTRLFDDGLFARSFGGAGFNRHLLHHLEPQISYTRLAELETYLMGTSARAALDARRATYWSAFRALWADDRGA